MKSFLSGTLIVVLIFSSCAVKKASVSNDNLVIDGKIWSALWHQRAAEYKALCFQAYNVARFRLDNALKQKYDKQVAIITDIDETVLDNSPNTISQALAGKDFEPEAWYAWTAKASADTIPGSASFLKYAASKGVTIFYITNREERERNATLKNLQKFNLPNADNSHIFLKQTTSGKETRRLEVQKNYEVIMLIGDNLSDFSNVFDKQPEGSRTSVTQNFSSKFGDKFIVLPNVIYGDWESSLFQYNYKLSPREKADIIRGVVKSE